jgi:hypothetical protein
MTAQKRQEVITFALRVLKGGSLADVLPELLMDKYGLTPAEARDLAAAARRRHKAESEPK